MNSIRSFVSSLALLALAGVTTAADKPSEADLLATLASDAGVREKAVACQHLANWGTAKSVPALAALLSDEKLSDYARSGLEIIDDPSAAAALRDALPKLTGRLLAGAVTSLGVRRDPAAVPELRKLALDPARGVATNALASLGMIGTAEAAQTISTVLADGSANLRIPAGHAALVAARHLAADGNPDAAKTVLASVVQAAPNDLLVTAAKRLGTSLDKSPNPLTPASGRRD